MGQRPPAGPPNLSAQCDGAARRRLCLPRVLTSIPAMFRKASSRTERVEIESTSDTPTPGRESLHANDGGSISSDGSHCTRMWSDVESVLRSERSSPPLFWTGFIFVQRYRGRPSRDTLCSGKCATLMQTSVCIVRRSQTCTPATALCSTQRSERSEPAPGVFRVQHERPPTMKHRLRSRSGQACLLPERWV